MDKFSERETEDFNNHGFSNLTYLISFACLFSHNEYSTSVFINYESDEGFHYAPMTYYTNRDAFNPPRVVSDAIKLETTSS